MRALSFSLARLFCLLFLGAAIGLAAPALASAAVNAFTFDPASTLSFAPGQEEGKAVFVLKLTGDATAGDGTLELSERGASDRPATTVKFEAGQPNQGSGSLTWYVTANVSGLPTNSSLSRFLTARFGEHSQTLSYTVTNRPTGTFAWKLTPVPDKRRWNGSDALPLSLLVGPIPATKVRLLSTAFFDDQSLTALGGGFKICPIGGTCDGGPMDLSANELHSLQIQNDGKVDGGPGDYRGTFTLVSAEKPEGESFSTTLYVSSWKWQTFGALLIAVGILASLYVNVWLQNRNDRNARLMPAALLADQASRLRADYDKLAATQPVTFANADDQLNALEDSLSIKALQAQGYVGGSVPFLKMPSGATAAPEAYKSFLDDVGKRLTALSVVLHGCREAVGVWSASSLSGAADALAVALRSMDGLILPMTSPPASKESLSSALQPILQNLRTEVSRAAGIVDDAGSPARGRPFAVGYTSERIAFDTAASNLVGWVAFGLLSFAVGGYLLIVANPGFGQWRDLLMCLLWGFGVPAAGEKLANLSGPGLAQGFGITLTKVA
ncbi:MULTISPECIES: hypothetical protein [unclassified Ensifer]|uniref:hypothetical protein n=1 Tax=unclassified Ensifer TaxID=2633371 RepID=UPI000AE7F35B|nr:MULTISPECIES: hypothetical protein [unclassified Ensifer]